MIEIKMLAHNVQTITITLQHTRTRNPHKQKQINTPLWRLTHLILRVQGEIRDANCF